MKSPSFTLEEVIGLLQATHSLYVPTHDAHETAQSFATTLAKLIDADHGSMHLLHQWNPNIRLVADERFLLHGQSAHRDEAHLPECLAGGNVVTMFADCSHSAHKTRTCNGRIPFYSSTIVSIARGGANEAPAVLALARDAGRTGFSRRQLRIVHVMHRAMKNGGISFTVGNRELNLSPRQKTVLEHLKEGCSEKEVAGALGISHHTVHHYVKSLYKRFQVGSRAELLSLLLGRGKKHLALTALV
jgi:DNA-binding CsgD family transcriptional regulator